MLAFQKLFPALLGLRFLELFTQSVSLSVVCKNAITYPLEVLFELKNLEGTSVSIPS